MTSARLGRMSVGRCVTVNYQLGCWVDALALLDSRCTGRKRCDVTTADAGAHLKFPCRHDLMVYLDASYTCVKGK